MNVLGAKGRELLDGLKDLVGELAGGDEDEARGEGGGIDLRDQELGNRYHNMPARCFRAANGEKKKGTKG